MPKMNAIDFALRAQSTLEYWEYLVGKTVIHNAHGAGVVTHATVNPVRIEIAFKNEEETEVQTFDQFVCRDLEDIDLPQEIYAKLNPGQEPQSAPVVSLPAQKFQINDDVCLVRSTSQRGRVSRAFPDHNGEWNYEVYISADNQPIFKESDLKHYSPDLQWGYLDDLLRDLAIVKMKRPLSNALYALYASRTKFEVYQFKPALKFLSNPDQRLLIADEVGLGKTIEAGIIYLELQARIGLDRVLFVCPSSLKQKWQSEMKSRFDEDFIILDRAGIDTFLKEHERLGDHAQLRAIVSLESIRRRDVAEKFKDVKFDLVVIDEAHHCRNTNTLAHAIASTLIDNSDAALLLTATPLQMGREDLFNLLRILSPGEFDNFNAFLNRLEPNKFVNKAAEYLMQNRTPEALSVLQEVENTPEDKRFLGNPHYHDVIDILKTPYPRRQELITAQRKLLELNTLASIFTRTRKRDVQEKAPKRTAFTLAVNFTPEEKRLYNEIVEEVRNDYQWRHNSGRGSGWVTIMKERQAASCISAVVNKSSIRLEEEWEEKKAFQNEFNAVDLSSPNADSDWYFDDDDVVERSSNTAAVRAHVAYSVVRPALSVDTKFEVFWGALKKILEEDSTSKVLVFSYFVGTIDHISSELEKRNVNARAIHGKYDVAVRQKTIEQFRDDPQIRVLISSDVGSEGLDFQFCNTLFNYDLPWNPMKVEQRIGRIDRFGQESERIRIYNLAIADSVEERILIRLYDRIEIFKQSIGDIEVILGERIKELAQAVFSQNLTPDEEIVRAEAIADIILRQKQDMEEFEEKRMQFLGQEAILSTAVNQTIDSGHFISDVEIRSVVGGYIKEKFKHSSLGKKDQEDDTYPLRVNEDIAQEMKTYIYYGKKKNDRTAQQFVAKLVPGHELPVTFSHDMAYKRKLLEFITPRHPLTQAALEYWREKNKDSRFVYRVTFQTDIAPAGKYLFFIYALDSEGVNSDIRIIPVVISAESGDKNNNLSEQFLRLAQTSGISRNITGATHTEDELSKIQEAASQFMTAVRDRLRQEMEASNDSVVNARLAAVNQSFLAKQRHIKDILNKVSNTSIQRMYEGQLRNMEAKKNAKELEIEKGRQLNVNFSLQLRGFVDVVGADN